MKIWQHALLCLLFFLFSNYIIPAQKPNIRFDHLTVENGLSGSRGLAFCQDSSGFIWIGTSDGLNRFDGINFKAYNHIPGDTSSLSDNFIYRLIADRKGNLWIGTLKGLNLFNPRNESFQTINLSGKGIVSGQQPEIISITEDPAGNIWISTGIRGVLFKVYSDSTNKKIYHSKYFEIPKALSADAPAFYVLSVYFSSEQVAWIGTPAGLLKMKWSEAGNDTTITWSQVFSAADSKNSFSPRIEYISGGENNSVYAFLGNGSVARFNPSAIKNFTPENTEWLVRASDYTQKIELLNYVFDRNGNLWIGTNNNGIYKFPHADLIQKTTFSGVQHIANNPDDPTSLLNNQVFSLLADKSGLVWIGSDAGISIYNQAKENFNNSDVDFFPDDKFVSVSAISTSQDFIWIGSDGSGISGWNRRTRQLVRADQRLGGNDGMINNSIQQILIDYRGNLWAATSYGLAFWSKENQYLHGSTPDERIVNVKSGIKTLHSITAGNGPLSGNVIFSLLEDYRKNIWVGTGNGLDCLDPARFSVINRFNTQGEDENTSLSNNIVRCLLADDENNIWIGTENGLNCLNLSSGIIRKYFSLPSHQNTLSNSRISCLFQSADGMLWIGTYGGGLNQYDKKKDRFTVYTTNSGLANNVVNGITEDENHNLWISTNYGISMFNPMEKTFSNYNTYDGLKSNSFNPCAVCKSTDGELFFGSIKGINSFYPSRISKNNFVPPVAITNFKIFDKSVFTPGFEEIKKSFVENKFVELKGNQNFFSFEFAALNYINPAKNQYKYKLEGFHDDWIDNGTLRIASFTNVNPGTYTFRVVASNNDGVWNEEGASMIVRINPPWFKSIYFKLIAGLILSSLVYLITAMRIRTIKEKKERELMQHSAQMKEQFLANMSHEIRTPMNAIVGMTRLLREQNPREDQKKYLDAIGQSSDNLLVIINDILDFSKIEAGKMELEFIPFSVKKLMADLYETFHLKASEKGLEFSCSVDDAVPEAILGDPIRINEVLINLVGNALKFTSRGSVRAECCYKGVYIDANGMPVPDVVTLQFSVSDTGIGIPEDKTEKIFESFSQASGSTTRHFGGTGLGLTISKRLVELHGGRIKVTSKPGVGSVFSFSIPFELTSADKIKDDRLPSIAAEPLLSIMKILLVEDNEFNRMVAVDTLQSLVPGITIDVAQNGWVAFQKAGMKKYDLILMDVQMPEMDGYTATRKIRSELPAPFNSVRIIAMTAGALKSEADKCFQAGMDDYISKPFSPELLLEKIKLQYVAGQTL